MIHERRLPLALAEDMERVYHAKLLLLNWLLRSPPLALNDNTLLVQQFGQSLGKWLWIRIRKPEKRTNFGKAVMLLATNAQTNPNEALLVANAITYDAHFHNFWDATGNELRFPRLYPTWLESIKNVAEPFYGWLADSGFEPEPFGLEGAKLDRATLMKAFRPQSHRVCGYCDGPLGEMGTNSEANDCDHFFPKSEWPHLAIHPANLFSACQGCNSRWKLANTPMGKADALGLNDTYHPMLRPGSKAIVVKAVVNAASTKIEIKITDPKFPRRAKTLVETLDLESRWENSVNEQFEQNISALVAKTARDKGLGEHPTPDSVQQLIDNDIVWKQSRIGLEERCLREIAALKCMKDELLQEVISSLA